MLNSRLGNIKKVCLLLVQETKRERERDREKERKKNVYTQFLIYLCTHELFTPKIHKICISTISNSAI